MEAEPGRRARIGVIGCGWWATRAHLPALAEHPDAEIAGIADPDEANLARAGERFDVPPDRRHRSAAALLDAGPLDGAIVAVPHALHAPVAREVLERGVQLLLEKPMTIRPEDARELEALAAAAGVELLLSYGWHYNRQAIALRDRIAAGAIGTVEFVACQYASVVRQLYRGDPEPYRDVLGFPLTAPGARTYADPAIAGGGQGQTQTTHMAALLFFLTGLRPVQVVAMVERFELEVDLVDAVAVRFAGGALGSLGSTGSVTPAHPESLSYRLYGTEGHVAWDVYEGRASIAHRDGTLEELPALPEPDRYPERAPARNLVDVCLGRSANGSPAWLGVRAVELLDAMYRSAAEGRSVSL